MASTTGPAEFDTSSHREFVEYYKKQSLTEATRQRFEAIRSGVLRLANSRGVLRRPLNVLDIGCGAGMQAATWASGGDRAYGVDINAALVEIARERTLAEGLDVRFDVGSATCLPYETDSMDVCLMPELLEHVRDWEACLTEAIRVLRKGGILFLSTSNYLCPVQHEFNLPFYAWYPPRLKRYFEKRAITTRPEIANYARYPAVNWFSYYGLARHLQRRGLSCFDRFDMVKTDGMRPSKVRILWLVKHSRVLRLAGHMCTAGTVVFAIKGDPSALTGGRPGAV
jgi:ubiquinone/menaquinone biosynthesis C-methylase UbiE